MTERYNRQNLIEGWDQSKISNAKVAVVGSDFTARHVIMPLAALGIGNIRILDNSRAYGDIFLDKEMKGDSIVSELEAIVEKANPDVSVTPVHATLVNDASKYLLEGVDLVVEATNDPRSKVLAMEYCDNAEVPMISLSSMRDYAKLLLFDGDDMDPSYLLPEFRGESQDEFVSLVMGGIVVDEVKKILMHDEDILEKILYYNLTVPERFTFGRKESKEKEIGEFGRYKALVIGAGALGTFVGPGLMRLGMGEITIIDYDVIEESNLNRQILYYGQVGRNKSEALAEKLKKISYGLLEIEPRVEKFDENFKNEGYDIVYDCVDNFATRKCISDWAIKHNIPLISGGTSYVAGQCAIYIPGKTSCINHQLNLEEHAEESVTADEGGCALAPNPSTIMTNQVISGYMVNETKAVLKPDKYVSPEMGTLRYDTSLETRIHTKKSSHVCDCGKRRNKK
ncbi:MAG: ThiF family adenylyltransferase [Candidatus Woesearchaeota archaeon]